MVVMGLWLARLYLGFVAPLWQRLLGRPVSESRSARGCEGGFRG